MRDTNPIVRTYADKRRYPTDRLGDGEVVILGCRRAKRRGWWALEPHAGGVRWAFYLAYKPVRVLPCLKGVKFDDHSSDEETYLRFPSEVVAERLMHDGPKWFRVTPRRVVSPEAASHLRPSTSR